MLPRMSIQKLMYFCFRWTLMHGYQCLEQALSLWACKIKRAYEYFIHALYGFFCKHVRVLTSCTAFIVRRTCLTWPYFGPVCIVLEQSAPHYKVLFGSQTHLVVDEWTNQSIFFLLCESCCYFSFYMIQYVCRILVGWQILIVCIDQLMDQLYS